MACPHVVIGSCDECVHARVRAAYKAVGREPPPPPPEADEDTVIDTAEDTVIDTAPAAPPSRLRVGVFLVALAVLVFVMWRG